MDNIFLKAGALKPRDYAGLPLLHLVGVRPTSGQIGIEIEVEGNKFPKDHGYQNIPGDEKFIPPQWKYTKDGSLRGDDNAEYVLARPLMFNEVDKAISDLWEMFEKYGSVLADSNRTSVHVHLNVQDFHINRLCSFVAMYFVVEELLTTWCGDHRIGNLFCLRGRDAPAIITRLKEFFNADGYGYEFSQGMHYAGLNPSAIHKFGSIEIRSLRGVNDPQVVLDWVRVLERLYTLSADFKDPRKVVEGFSGEGPIEWLKGILGDTYGTVVNNVPYTTDEIRDILYNGIRLAQDLCYCRDWSEFKEQKVGANPFGRKTKAFTVSPAPIISHHSLTDAVYVGGSTPAIAYPSTQFTHSQLINQAAALYNNATITSSTYESLMGMPDYQIESFLNSIGYLPEQETDEPDYDFEDDYYEDED